MLRLLLKVENYNKSICYFVCLMDIRNNLKGLNLIKHIC